MAGKQPSDADKLVAHGIVGVGSGLLAGQKAGVVGFVLGAALGIFAHVLLDAPLAGVIAQIT